MRAEAGVRTDSGCRLSSIEVNTHCKESTQEEIAHVRGRSGGLVREYLDLIRDFQIPPLSDPSEQEGSQSAEKRKESWG
jgi:hypothetical protein